MKTTINKIVMMALIGLIPLLAGCLGSGGYNPVADNSLSDQVNASLTAESEGPRFRSGAWCTRSPAGPRKEPLVVC